MDARRSSRIAQVAMVILALALGGVTASALARQGSDDGTGTTGTTGTTQTGTTETTPQPGVTTKGRRITAVGTVTARDTTAGTFALTVKNRKRSHDAKQASAAKRSKTRTTRVLTVRASRIPAIGRFVQVKGTRLDDGTIQATRVKILRGCSFGDDDVATTSRRGSGDDRCEGRRGRGDDDGTPDQGRGDDSRGDGDDDGTADQGRGDARGDDDSRGRGRGGDDDHSGHGRGGDDDDDDSHGRGRGGDDD